MNWLYFVRADESLSPSAQALGRALVEKFGELHSDYASASDYQLAGACGLDVAEVERGRQQLSARGYLQQLYFERACPVYRLVKPAELQELINGEAAA